MKKVLFVLSIVSVCAASPAIAGEAKEVKPDTKETSTVSFVWKPKVRI